jgi:hypothetical protein
MLRDVNTYLHYEPQQGANLPFNIILISYPLYISWSDFVVWGRCIVVFVTVKFNFRYTVCTVISTEEGEYYRFCPKLEYTFEILIPYGGESDSI